jgi:hypothetical protein
MLINLKNTKNQFIMTINHEELTNSGEVSIFPKSELPADIDLKSENIFFTCIDKETGVLSGYQVTAGWKAVKVWQIKVAENKGDMIHQVRSQHQTSSEIEHQHYLPTAFVGDNLIYKYLDSNLFAISTMSLTDTLSIYIINGVSGKIVYKFSIPDISSEHPIDMLLQEHQLVLSYKRQSWGVPQ